MKFICNLQLGDSWPHSHKLLKKRLDLIMNGMISPFIAKNLTKFRYRINKINKMDQMDQINQIIFKFKLRRFIIIQISKLLVKRDRKELKLFYKKIKLFVRDRKSIKENKNLVLPNRFYDEDPFLRNLILYLRNLDLELLRITIY